ncbi:hypothetical protein BH11PLA2_BH11PLA2_05840 [soil metagenome]
MIRWHLSLLGLALAVFGVVGLSGPGRIDIEDGQARYEAGRCFVEYGDPGIRDPRVVWHRFPGREGVDFTYYRLTGEVVATAFVALGHSLSDQEGTRHFIFALNGAATAAVLAVVYAVWFRRQGSTPRMAIAFAAAGIFCTPCWFYAASTFDDLLCTLIVVVALVLADRARSGNVPSLFGTAIAVGLSLNSKQPLAAILLPALAMADDAKRSLSWRLGRASVLVAGLGAGVVGYTAYEAWKFPPEQKAKHAAIRAEWGITVFEGNPLEALVDYTVGPSSGTLWYCPTILLGGAGLLAMWRANQKRIVIAIVLSCTVVTLFFSVLTFYKGGVCWGPRYLTPLFGILWLFAPQGVAILGPRITKVLLVLGILVQILGLSLIPERLYVQRELHSGFYVQHPWWYLHPALGHIVNRPAEIIDALTAPVAAEFTPAPSPTFTLPVFDKPFYNGPKGIEGVRRYTLLNTFRPWWATYPHLTSPPVNVARTVVFFVLLTVCGILLTCSWSRDMAPHNEEPSWPSAPK